MDDTQRWSDNTSPISPSCKKWLFSFESSPNTITLWVLNDAGHEMQSCKVHTNLALALAYLDVDYWVTSKKDISIGNRNRIERYLLHLRTDVVKELMAADTSTLVDGSTTLLEWAVRVYHDFGHSNTGRTMYKDQCEAKGSRPYDEEFIHYGENYLYNFHYGT